MVPSLSWTHGLSTEAIALFDHCTCSLSAAGCQRAVLPQAETMPHSAPGLILGASRTLLPQRYEIGISDAGLHRR